MRWSLGLVAIGILLCGQAMAAPITQAGLVFSDEGGGFELLSVTGTGSLDDPFIVTEAVTGDREIVLIIRDFGRHFGNRVGTQHIAAFAMRKIVINRTGRVWQNYQMELRELPNRHSPYHDGLSFGQNSLLGESYARSSFPSLQRFDEPEDSLGFGGTFVAPGESATFDFIVSDMSPVGKFYLYQIPLQPLSQAPEAMPDSPTKTGGERETAGLSWPPLSSDRR